MQWVVGLVVIGILLACIEIFIPGIGAFAILSVISFCAAVVALMIVANNIIVTVFGIIVLVGLIGGAIAFARKSKRIFLRTEVKGQAAESLSYLVGKEAYAYSMLRPAGTIEIAGELFDAIAIGSMIPKGEKVKVVRVDHRKVFVRSVQELAQELEQER